MLDDLPQIVLRAALLLMAVVLLAHGVGLLHR
jgi:hypothetical protein